ncbi:MAG: T9SS type A sorting domain-containing protein [candidate division WOR-3 bacterium]
MKFKLTLSTILLLSTIIGLNAQSCPPDGWRVDIPLVIASNSQQYSEVVAAGNNIHSIWVDNRDGTPRLYYKKSIDDGFNWSNEIAVSLQGEIILNEERNVGITLRGINLYVVYSVETQNGYAVRFCRSTDNGETWGGYQTIANSLPRFPQPAITVNGDNILDSIRVVYCDELDIVYVASGDGGISWHSYDHLNFEDAILLMYPSITTINNRPHISIGANCAFAYARHLGGHWEFYGWEMNAGESYHYSRIVGNNSGYICMIFEYKNTVGTTYRSIWRMFSTNYGNSWNGGVIWNPTTPWGPENPDVIVDRENRLLLVYGHYSNGDLYGCISPDFGTTWEEPFLLVRSYDNPPEPPAYAPHPSIAKGSISKHVVFEKWVNGYDLFYLANDDLLLSDDNRATAFNNGRHLIRDPNTGSLHLVYHSQNRVHYSMSDYTGQNWTPYHITEDPATQKKDEGWYPTIGLVPGWLVAKMPCIVYCSGQGEVKYRWLEDGTQQWHGFTILSATTGLDPGPPSVYTYGDTVYVVFSVNMLEGTQQLWSAIYYYQFPFYATEAPPPTVIDYELGMPLAYKHASIVVDGNGNPHIVWDKWVTQTDYEIYYRWRQNGSWQAIELVSNINQPEYVDKSPHVDCYGNELAAVWYDEIAGLPNEIQRRKKRIFPPRWYRIDNPPYSQSPDFESEFPVNVLIDFSIWSEKQPATDYDIRYRSDTYGFGWISQASEKESFCHSQLQKDFSPWDLYTIFTKGDAIPYQIVCVHQQFGSGPPGSESPFYVVETGQDSISPFCLHRDGKITYSNYSVEYGNSDLTYELSFLDPTFPYHKIKGTAYFEGNSNQTYEVWINGVKKHTFTLRPNQPYDFDVLIPKELYQNTHRITLSIKNPNNTGVSLAGLSVYRKPEGKSGGGPQSYGEKNINNTFTISPNPFRDKLQIKLNINAELGKNCQLKIYDVSGRLVRKFSNFSLRQNLFIWDGDGENGKLLPEGVYFIRLQCGAEETTKKAVLIR